MKVQRRRGGLLVAGWLLPTLAVLFLDYLTGPEIKFPILFLIPVTLASWYGSLWIGAFLGAVMPLVRLLLFGFWDEALRPAQELINALIAAAVLLAFAFLVHRLGQRTRAMSRELHVLRGILPICGHCKKIRDPKGQWHPVESYISQRSEAVFSHSLCTECLNRHYPGLADVER